MIQPYVLSFFFLQISLESCFTHSILYLFSISISNEAVLCTTDEIGQQEEHIFGIFICKIEWQIPLASCGYLPKWSQQRALVRAEGRSPEPQVSLSRRWCRDPVTLAWWIAGSRSWIRTSETVIRAPVRNFLHYCAMILVHSLKGLSLPWVPQ